MEAPFQQDQSQRSEQNQNFTAENAKDAQTAEALKSAALGVKHLFEKSKVKV